MEEEGAVLAAAEAAGKAEGKTAAEWYCQEQFTKNRQAIEVAHRVIAGIADCDPVIMDALPYPQSTDEWGDASDAYIDAYVQAAEEEILRAADFVLAEVANQ